MKIKIIISYILVLFIFTGCFEDEGNYEYDDLNAPTFTFEDKYPSAIGYDGSNLKCKGEFIYTQADSLKLMENTRYEWSINGVVISTQKDLDVPTAEVFDKLGLISYPDNYLHGLYSVINKSNGVSYLKWVHYFIRPKYWKGSWIILSKDNGKSKVSYQRISEEYAEGGNIIKKYENFADMFGQKNDGLVIPGNPIKLVDHKDNPVSPAVGATTVLTDQVRWEVNNENFRFAYDLKDEFLEGTPTNFNIIDSYHDNYYDSFLINTDGQIFSRKMSKNYLGGKYLTSPYSVDDKNSKIEFFSQQESTVRMMYLYDSNNNRLLALNTSKKIVPIRKASSGYEFDITDMGEGVEVLAITNKAESPTGVKIRSTANGVVVLKENGQFYVGEFATYMYGDPYLPSQETRKYQINAQFQPDSKIWFPGIVKKNPIRFKYAIFYTCNNEIRYFDRETGEDNVYMSFDHKVTAAGFDTYSDDPYGHIAIGLENGDFFLMDTEKEVPEIIPGTKFNVGGEIVDVSMVGSRNIQ